jgi:hypothetical protein
MPRGLGLAHPRLALKSKLSASYTDNSIKQEPRAFV